MRKQILHNSRSQKGETTCQIHDTLIPTDKVLNKRQKGYKHKKDPLFSRKDQKKKENYILYSKRRKKVGKNHFSSIID